jgi:hypothetical protein
MLGSKLIFKKGKENTYQLFLPHYALGVFCIGKRTYLLFHRYINPDNLSTQNGNKRNGKINVKSELPMQPTNGSNSIDWLFYTRDENQNPPFTEMVAVIYT